MAQYEEIVIDQGADVAIEVHLINKDGTTKNLTNHTITAKMKKTYNSDSADTFNFNSIVANPASSGIATLSLTNLQTDQLKPGKYVYDVEMSFLDSDSNTIIERVLEGRITVTPSVTR
jgi:GTPase Era involved in 16S rRNA processing